MKTIKKLLLITLVAFATIIILITPSVHAVTISTQLKYNKRVLSNSSYNTPGLNSDYIPQGLCRISYKQKTYRLITAYDHYKKLNSRIYIISSSGKLLKTVTISNSPGGHCGGIAEYGDNIWIASTKIMYIISKAQLFAAKNNEAIRPIKLIENKQIYGTKSKYLSFCTSYNGILWVGYFSKKESSYMYGFTCEIHGDDYKLKKVARVKLPKKVQGVSFVTDNIMALSVSYGVFPSKIYIAKLKKSSSSTQNYSKYTLKMKSSYTVPAGSEQIYFTGNKNLYILFESGAKCFMFKYANILIPGIWTEDRVVLLDL